MSLGRALQTFGRYLPAGVNLLIGEEHLEHGEPPRVVAVPVSEDFGYEAPSNTPARDMDIGTVVRTRSCSLDLHLWAVAIDRQAAAPEHIEAVELLLRQVVGALHRAAPGAYHLDRADWRGGRQGQYGRSLVLGVTIDFMLPLDVPTTATVDVVPQEANLTADLVVPGTTE